MLPRWSIGKRDLEELWEAPSVNRWPFAASCRNQTVPRENDSDRTRRFVRHEKRRSLLGKFFARENVLQGPATGDAFGVYVVRSRDFILEIINT